ncbi:MAG: aspartate kinase [Anaerolineae bacterium]|nr:aspartate kinase [Anaerolineae bacterium]
MTNPSSPYRITMKFGGTSVGSVEAIARAAEIVDQARRNALHPTPGRGARQVAIVVSAMSGVTNSLVRAARAALEARGEEVDAIVRALRERHRETVAPLIDDAGERTAVAAQIDALLDYLHSLCRAIGTLGELTPRGLDVVSGLGERLCAPIVAAALRAHQIDAEAVEATALIVTDDVHGAANPLMEQTAARTRARLAPLLERGAVPVITGFIGATRSGTPTTLGRGGSDYSATIVGACLASDEIWIWSDVDGVMSADPRVVPSARTIEALSYNEAAEFSYFGAKVIHPKTILPAAAGEIPLRILNSFNPTHPGTRIIAHPLPNGRVVKGITAIRAVSEVTVEGRGMIGIPGIAARVFAAVAAEQVNVLMISQSSSEQSICFVVPVESAQRTIDALHRAFEYDILRHNVEHIWSKDDVAIMAVVGERMKGTVGIASRLFGALAEAGINILTIAQGSSEHNISLVIEGRDADRSVRAVHETFGLGAARDRP